MLFSAFFNQEIGKKIKQFSIIAIICFLAEGRMITMVPRARDCSVPRKEFCIALIELAFLSFLIHLPLDAQ